ncbi:hypothetical protein LXL04_032099 [Taraxacum kok-saghyz]
MISNPQGNISYKETRKKVVDSNPAVRELEETAKETMYTFTVMEASSSECLDPFDAPECEAFDIFVNESMCAGKGCPYSCVKTALRLHIQFFNRDCICNVSRSSCAPEVRKEDSEMILQWKFSKTTYIVPVAVTSHNGVMLAEASLFQFPIALRMLFATILVFCDPGDVRKLWDDHYHDMSEDDKMKM